MFQIFLLSNSTFLVCNLMNDLSAAALCWWLCAERSLLLCQQQCPHSWMTAQWPKSQAALREANSRVHCNTFTKSAWDTLIWLCVVSSTCLQRLHLLQWVHLLPQPLQLRLHIIFLCSCISTTRRQEKNPRSDKHSYRARFCWSLCDVVYRYLRADEQTQPSWCGTGGWSWGGARRSREGGRQGGPDAPCLRAGGSYRTGHSGTTLYCSERNQKHCGQLNIYWPSVCFLPALAPTLFVFVQTSGGGEGGIRVEWQIMISLCLAFDKYLPGTRCTEQYSLSFHKQTGNSLTASLLQSVLHPIPLTCQFWTHAKSLC